MHRILSLDLARIAGAAWRNPGTGTFITRAFVLGEPGNLGAHLVNLQRIVGDLLDESGADTVIVERDCARGAATFTLRAYQAIADLVAAERGLKSLKKLMPSEARKLALGYGGGSKEQAQERARERWPLPPVATESQTAAVAKLAAKSGHCEFSQADLISGDEVDAVVLLVAAELRIAEAARVEAAKRAAKLHARSLRKSSPLPVRAAA